MVLTRSKAAKKAKKVSMKERLELVKKKINHTYQNLVLLDDKLIHHSRRFNLAKTENQRVFRYKLRLKLAVYEGVRNAFYEYARVKAEEIAELRREISNQRVAIISASDPEESESDEEESEFDDENDITDDV